MGNGERKAILEAVNKLPAMPKVLNQISAALHSPDVNSKDLAKLVEQDTALSAKVLQMANSPFFGFSRKVQTISQSIVLLGPKQLGYLAVSLSMKPKLANLAPSIDFSVFNAHSIACSLLTRDLATRLKLPDPEELFLCGLLHDVGKLVLA